MDQEADSRFWGHFNDIVEELENPPYCENAFYRALQKHYHEPIPLVERALHLIQELTVGLASFPVSQYESRIWKLTLLVLFYVDEFGRDTKVTADELKGIQPIDLSRSQIDRLKQLVKE